MMKTNYITKAAVLALTAATSTLAESRPPAGGDRDLCAAVLIAEAGGEGKRGMQAVWEIVHQRTRTRSMGHAHVVFQRWQFSCLNKRRPDDLIRQSRQHSLWRTAVAIASKLPVTNLTAKAAHYHATSIKRPYWAKGRKATAKIGRHVFYKLGY